jgi:beta-phosphoglucomutase-like phosphatase (HAD superfamily)
MSGRKQSPDPIADAARRLMFALDGINPAFPLAPGKVAEIEEAKAALRAALAAT